MIAEREGKPYGNADNPPPAVQEDRGDVPEEAIRHEVSERDADDSVLTEEEQPGRDADNPSLA